jgi:hypothetical protein
LGKSRCFAGGRVAGAVVVHRDQEADALVGRLGSAPVVKQGVDFGWVVRSQRDKREHQS